MFSLRKEKFIAAFMKWCERWKEFLNERTLRISGKTTYTHRRQRTARRSIKTHLPWIYTCEEYPDMQIPNTTNLLEGFNSQLKRVLHNHNGLNEANRKKFIDGFINTKKVGWKNQPTKCPLLKPKRLSAYQMSITPRTSNNSTSQIIPFVLSWILSPSYISLSKT